MFLIRNTQFILLIPYQELKLTFRLTLNKKRNMKYTILKSDDRGGANHGWLNTKHSYSFANYFDEKRIHFGALRVVNDDIITGGMGFGKHPHDNMEIITLPTKGGLKHADSMGTGSVIEAGDIQVMSAGTGVFHSEMNAYEDITTEFFQIWIFPNTQNVEPRYQQISYKDFVTENEWYQLLSPYADDQGVWIHQNAWMYKGNFTTEEKVKYKTHGENQGVFLMVIEGEIEFDGHPLKRRDAIEINTDEFQFKTTINSEILLIEVPMNF